MQKKWIAGALLVLGLLGMCGCSSQTFVSEQQTETVLTQEETEWEFQDGTYQMEVELLGGSGRASVTSPAKVEIKDGKAVATLEWSSPNYDYMLVDGEKYLPVNTEGNSVFQIPVEAFDQDIAVIADTVAMSTPHEIEYTLNFHAGENGQNAAKTDTTGQEDADGAENGQQAGADGTGAAAGANDTGMSAGKNAGAKGTSAATGSNRTASLVYDHSMELSYAENFAVDYYEGGYKLLTTRLNGDRILIVPKHQQVPEDAEALVSPSAEGKRRKADRAAGACEKPVSGGFQRNGYVCTVRQHGRDFHVRLKGRGLVYSGGKAGDEGWHSPLCRKVQSAGL